MSTPWVVDEEFIRTITKDSNEFISCCCIHAKIGDRVCGYPSTVYALGWNSSDGGLCPFNIPCTEFAHNGYYIDRDGILHMIISTGPTFVGFAEFTVLIVIYLVLASLAGGGAAPGGDAGCCSCYRHELISSDSEGNSIFTDREIGCCGNTTHHNFQIVRAQVETQVGNGLFSSRTSYKAMYVAANGERPKTWTVKDQDNNIVNLVNYVIQRNKMMVRGSVPPEIVSPMLVQKV